MCVISSLIYIIFSQEGVSIMLSKNVVTCFPHVLYAKPVSLPWVKYATLKSLDQILMPAVLCMFIFIWSRFLCHYFSSSLV
jgi:hypothetical protein